MKTLILILSIFLSTYVGSETSKVQPFTFKIVELDPYHYAITLQNNTKYPSTCTVFTSDGRWIKVSVASHLLKEKDPVVYIGHKTLRFNAQCTPKLPDRPI